MKNLDCITNTGSLARVAALIVIYLSMMLPIALCEAAHSSDTAPGEHDKRPVTVADSIQMTNLVGYDDRVSVDHQPALFAPDGEHFVIVTKKGDIETNTNDYSLLLYQTSLSLSSPAPVVLATLSSSSNRNGIQDVQWIDNRTLAFLGERPKEMPQVYEVDCITKQLEKLTNHSTSVIAYSITPDKKRFAFLAARPVSPLFDAKTRRSGLAISNQPLTDLIAGEGQWNSGKFADLFVETMGGKETRVEASGDITQDRIWLSPNGRYLIATSLVVDIPEIWKDYEDRSVQWRIHANPLHGDPRFLRQHVLIDVESGKTTALLDAPLGDYVYSEVLWSLDSSSVVVSGVYLPLNISDATERTERQSKKMIAEIKIPSLEIVTISSKEMCSGECWVRQELRWNLETGILLVEPIVYLGTSTPGSGPLAFERTASGWKEVDFQASAGAKNDPRMTVTFKEDMNTPPKLFATSAQTGQKVMLLDLNPQFENLQFGRVEDITFNATDGHKVSAGLYLPIDYTQGKKYPLVIQTHSWHPERFWIDGPWTSAFAAQALAGKGFVVLQLSEDISGSISSTPEEAPIEVAAYEGGIEYLDKLGIVDRNRVGVIGFSRSGLGVEFALTQSKYHFAAATLAEPSDAGYFFYVAILPSFSWRWPDLEGINGGSPFGDGLASWIKKSPTFNMQRVTTPVREEAYSPPALFVVWEWFAGLSRLGKPVDLIYIPDGDHVLIRPQDRMISQQGNVDWFSFWLKGEEDADPAKADQYKHWRELRKKQEENDARAKAATVN